MRNTANGQIYIKRTREGSVTSSFNSYFDLFFSIIRIDNDSRYVDRTNVRLVKLGQIALFSIYKPTTVRGKHLEEISQTYFASLMYKLITCAKDCDDFSISFDGKRIRRRG